MDLQEFDYPFDGYFEIPCVPLFLIYYLPGVLFLIKIEGIALPVEVIKDSLKLIIEVS